MANVVVAAVSTVSTYGGPGAVGTVNKPAGLGATPYTLVMCVLHFYADTLVSCAGWTVAGEKFQADYGGFKGTILYKQVSDGAAEPASYSPTIAGAGGDGRAQIYALQNVDTGTPIPSGGVSSAGQSDSVGLLTIAGATVATNGSLAIMVGASVYYDMWDNVPPGNVPTGWTYRAANEDIGCYDTTANQNAGTSIGATFLGTLNQAAAALLVVFQPTPAAGAGTSLSLQSAGTRQLRLSAVYRM